MYKRIKDLREDKDISQNKIADFLGVSQSTYSRYENGQLYISASILRSIAIFHDVSTDYLLNLTNEKKPYPAKKN